MNPKVYVIYRFHYDFYGTEFKMVYGISLDRDRAEKIAQELNDANHGPAIVEEVLTI